MPTVFPIVWEPPAVTGRYRNLQARDVAVWERWLALHAATVEAVAYDVAVGGVEPAGEGLTEQERRGWRYTTAQKIDVLLLEDSRIWAVEVKPIASLTAIGGGVGYPLVLRRAEPDLDVAGGGIVCGHLPLDIAWLTQQLQIRTWVV